jgi:hypothetical protein
MEEGVETMHGASLWDEDIVQTTNPNWGSESYSGMGGTPRICMLERLE